MNTTRLSCVHSPGPCHSTTTRSFLTVLLKAHAV